VLLRANDGHGAPLALLKYLNLSENQIRQRGCTELAEARHSEKSAHERWGAGVETQKNVRGEMGGWGRVPFNETYAPSFSTIYDGA